MSEDFFESILPPVKAVSEPPPHPNVPVVIAADNGGTDIEKLWEEIYTSEDLPSMDPGSMNGSMHSSSPSLLSHPGLTPGPGGGGGANKLIPIHNGLMQSPSINNGGKVFIVPNKRKSQFIQEQPAKAMRFMAGLESRKILQAAHMTRNNIANMNPHGPGNMPQVMENHEEEQEEEAETHSEIYAQYQPSKLKKGKIHPYPVVESSSLASVEVPNIRYNLSLPSEIISQGRLSNVQLESVIYACQRHEEMLPNGERAGYLIGDGAGVGKGRTLAAIIYENYILKRKRSVWISVSNDLKHDAERDLRDLGADIGIHALNKLRYAKINSPENGNLKKGVLFTTYASLIGECQSMPKSKYKTRFKQIVQWFNTDYDGVIVFDECHKAKNLMPQGSQKKTKTAELVLKLQESLPFARVIYSSATGASEPRNMAYMTRLGLWGSGTPFKKFEDFVDKLEDKVGAMELVAVDMKQRGMYIARQLSFANVTFRIQEVELANVKIGEFQFFDVYNESVDLWTKIFVKMNHILSKKMVSKKFAKTIWGQYWAAHQRFFKYLCMAGKVQECVKITIEAISQQKCVVIGLQSTGEAKTNEMLEESGGDLMEFVSCAKGILQSFILKFFPTEENIASMSREKCKTPANKAGRKKAGSKKNISLQDALGRDFLDKVADDEIGSSDDSDRITSSDESDTTVSERSNRNIKRKGAGGRGVIRDDDSEFDDDDVETLMDEFSRRCDDNVSNDTSTRMIQRELLDAMDRLSKKLPINTLDDLIRELGGPDFVAEMSGRKGRMVMDVDTGDITYNPRREVDVTLEQINLVEKDRFNTCQKLVAIISDAASTGISLHADKRYDNSLQRVHITLELPWSADRAIQQFGRTHRSNQLYPPEYVFLISDLAGERRFASTVAKRLESLGALTHGDRRATETRDLSQFNIDNKFGRRALDSIFDTAFRGKSCIVPLPPGIDLKKTLETVGLQPKDSKNVSKFLNRILGMHLHVQNALFQYYSDTMDFLIKQAKRNQEFDRGIIDLAKEDDNIFVEETQDFRMTFLGDDIKVQLHRVKNITGMSWRSSLEVPKGGANSLDGFYLTKSDSQRRIVLAVQKKDRTGGTWFTMYSPNVGEQTVMVELKALNSGYKKLSLEEAERVWTEIYTVTEDNCMHMYWYKQCRNLRSCDIGCRSKIRYVLSGSIFYIWDIISSIHKSPQLARVRLNDGSKIIGCIINPANKDKITEILSNRRSQPLDAVQKVATTGVSVGDFCGMAGLTPVRGQVHPVQIPRDRGLMKVARPLASKTQYSGGQQNQYYSLQNQQQNLSVRNVQQQQHPGTQMMMMSPLTTSGTTVRYNSPHLQRKVVISQGSGGLTLAPQQQQQHGNIRLVHMQQNNVLQPGTQKIMFSPTLRLSSPVQFGTPGGGGARIVYQQQSPGTVNNTTFTLPTLTPAPHIISVSGKGAPTKSVHPPSSTSSTEGAPITFMDLT